MHKKLSNISLTQSRGTFKGAKQRRRRKTLTIAALGVEQHTTMNGYVSQT